MQRNEAVLNFPWIILPLWFFHFPPISCSLHKMPRSCQWIISPWGTEERTVSTCTEFKQKAGKGRRAPEIMPITFATTGLSPKNSKMPSLTVSNFNSMGQAQILHVSVLERVSWWPTQKSAGQHQKQHPAHPQCSSLCLDSFPLAPQLVLSPSIYKRRNLSLRWQQDFSLECNSPTQNPR